MKYLVLVNGQSVEVEVGGGRVTIDGTTHEVSLQRIAGTPLRQLLIDGRPLTLMVESEGQGRWVLTSRGDRSELEVLDERARHIRTLTATSDQRRKPDLLRAPMPGLVVRVQVQPGQTITAGTGLVVLEAMKMENELKAAAGGRVKAVRVAPGQPVEKGEVLVEFEDEGT
jgi:biotin carboxyl carrier protein